MFADFIRVFRDILFVDYNIILLCIIIASRDRPTIIILYAAHSDGHSVLQGRPQNQIWRSEYNIGKHILSGVVRKEIAIRPVLKISKTIVPHTFIPT